MNELISQHARTVLIPDRRCTATNRDGERCGRSSALGQTVCNLHGGATPLGIQAARERLLAMVEPALDALLRALKTAPPCEHCGRSDADRDPVVIRAAQIVLDRAGHGPSATVQMVAPPPSPFADLTLAQLADRAEQIAIEARRAADDEAERLLNDDDAHLLDAGNVEDGFVVDADEEDRR